MIGLVAKTRTEIEDREVRVLEALLAGGSWRLTVAPGGPGCPEYLNFIGCGRSGAVWGGLVPSETVWCDPGRSEAVRGSLVRCEA